MAGKVPVIKIDHKKCTVPYYCKKCLQICPQASFQVMPIKQVKYQETDPQEPGAWRLFAPYADKCITCNKCLDVCPEGALEIII